MLISIAYTKLMHKDKPHFLQRRPKNEERIPCEEVERKVSTLNEAKARRRDG